MMYKLPKAGLIGHACLWMFFSLVFRPASAQTYPTLWLGNANTTGALQTPLTLGNSPTSTTQPEFTITTSDNGWSLMNVIASAWGAQFNISRGDPGGSYRVISIDGATGEGSNLSLYNASNAASVYFTAQGTSYFTGGAVAIGTTNPGSSQLAVQGTIACNRVTVTQTSPFPDYVFDAGYRLPQLDSLSAFLKANHHLPDIPSADNVKKDGLDLGASQVVMLQKIEELTLYVIEQDKASRALMDKVKLLEEYNQALEKRLRVLGQSDAAEKK
jgi:hypothetical protein